MAKSLFNLFLCFLTIFAVDVSSYTYKNKQGNLEESNGTQLARVPKRPLAFRRYHPQVIDIDEIMRDISKGITPKPLPKLPDNLCTMFSCVGQFAPVCAIDWDNNRYRLFASACHMTQFNYCDDSLEVFRSGYSPVFMERCNGIYEYSRLWY